MTRSGAPRTGQVRHRKPGGGRRPGKLAIAIGVTGTACAGIALAVLSAVTPGTGPVGPAARSGTAGARPAARVEPAAPSTFPAGFWSGSDSTGMALHGRAPARLPGTGAADGGYIGMAGNWATWQHCGTKEIWSSKDSAAANASLTRYHQGIGTGVYWFMAGPGVDPHYNGTVQQAYAWGAAQAARTLYVIAHKKNRVTYPVVFMDIELPGHAPTFTPADDNGWNTVYTSPCSGQTKAGHIAPRVDRADLDGFAAYLARHSADKAGVYSSPGIWSLIFGHRGAALIPHTYEWTYNDATSSLARRPAGWCLSGTRTCARFFGGVTARSRYALMWQWSGGGGTWNGFGDFDQIDGSRTPSAVSPTRPGR
jgi:hypothetical protein